MAGRLALVLGPSGAGKDTLILAARAALAGDPRFAFPRRVVTRQAVAALEDHESVSEQNFARRAARGEFALNWEAHGLHYGVPASLVDDLGAGRIAVVNGSRAMAAAAQARFAGMAALLIEATPEMRARRLAGRGRESEAEIAARLGREVPDEIPGAIRIDNSGSLDQGIARFLVALEAIARQ